MMSPTQSLTQSLTQNPSRGPNRSLLTLLIAILSSVTNACDETNTPPKLLPLSELSTPVNQTAELLIYGRDAEEGGLDFSFTLTPLPNVATEGEVGRPTLTPLSLRQAVFRWAPSIADVGIYELTVRVTDRGGLSDSETIRVEVFSDLLNDQTLRFVQPTGAGQSFDPTPTRCLDFMVEVAADGVPDEDILISLGEPEILGVVLDPPGAFTGKRRLGRWCPSSEQLEESDRYTITLRAQSRTLDLSSSSPPQSEREPTWSAGIQKRYLVRLEREDPTPVEGCIGRPPTLEHTPPQRLSGFDDYRVELTVRDDLGVKSPPLLALWTGATSPEVSLDDPRWSLSELIPKESGSSDDSILEQSWSGLIPNLGLGEGEVTRIYYAFIVTDNDDPSGTRCDHTIESVIYEISVTGGAEGGGQGVCDPCTLNEQCGGVNDLCLSYNEGSYCGRFCDVSAPCNEGEDCLGITAPNGSPTTQCVPVTLSCVERCIPDQFDQSASTPEAPELALGSYVDLSICGEELDLYQIEIPPQSGLEVALSFDATQRDFDLAVALSSELNANGELVFSYESASSTSSLERIRIGCAGMSGTPERAWVAVLPYEGSDLGVYDLTLSPISGECARPCQEDEFEGLSAAMITDGVYDRLELCEDSVDRFVFDVEAGWVISAFVEFDLDRGDLNLTLYGADREPILRDEAIRRSALVEWRAEVTGTYMLEVRGVTERVRNRYSLDLYIFSTDPCVSTRDCASGLFCYPQLGCLGDECNPTLGCGPEHACLYPIDAAFTMTDPSLGRCAVECQTDIECRMAERCKEVGQGVVACIEAGSAAWGQRCASHHDCADSLICADLAEPTQGRTPSARCVRAGCERCELEEICVSSALGERCLPRCALGCPSGWTCALSGEGRESLEACYPIE